MKRFVHLLFLCVYSSLISLRTIEEDWNLDFPERVTKYGYDVTEYNVTTSDGYILTIFRVKHPECEELSRPVFMLHGFTLNAIAWLDAGPDASLLFLLARDCYDVWAGTNRGTHYGRSHVNLNPDEDKEFWNYSLDDIVAYDLPPQIDFVLNETGVDKVDYIGYSQGGGIVLALLSDNANYASKFNKVIGLAPITRLTNTKSVVIKGLTTSVATLGVYVLPTGEAWLRQTTLLATICKFQLTNIFCRGFISALDTYHPDSLSDYTISVYAANLPGGISVKLAQHTLQSFNRDGFKKFDYGNQNIDVYGTEDVPIYDLSKIKNEVYFIYGADDHMVDPDDMEWAISQIPNGISKIVDDPLWNHVDMIFSQNVPTYVYPIIIDVLSN